MADYSAIRKAYEEDEKLNESLKQKLDTNNTLYDNQKTSITDTYSKQIEDSKLEYEDAYRENAVQKKVNEFYIKEDMANMGLSDSGLSRSQITANQLSYANQKADIDRQRQSMVDGLTREMTSILSDIENERLSKEQSIRDSDIEYRDRLAASQYATEVEAETEQHKADVEAETKRQEYYYDYLTKSAKTTAEADAKVADNKNNEYKSLYTHLNESGGEDYDYSAQMIDTYLQKYDIDPDTSAGRAELNALLKAAGITYEQFEHYTNNGTIYTTVDNYKIDGENGAAKGIIKYDYKKDGMTNYKIVVKKDTPNDIFGIGNLLGNVDNNDVVDIYYADGKTLVASNVRLGDLTESNGKKLTQITYKATKDDVNNGTLINAKLDLSKEKFKVVKK